MICNRCGNRNPLNSKFCRFCGSKLDEPGASQPVPEEEFYVPTATPIDHERVLLLLDEAFAQSEKGEIGAALHACKEALVIDPRSVPVHSLLGLLYERVGEKEKAIAEYERVLQLNPDSALEREALARLRGEEEPAAAPVMTRSSYRPFPYVNTMPIVAAATAGILIILVAYHRASSQTNRRTVKVEPPKNQLVVNVTNYTEQGRQALARGDYQMAAQLFQQALAQNPNDAQAQQGLEQARRGMMLAAAPRPMSPATAGRTMLNQKPTTSGTTPAPTGPTTPLQPILPNPVTRNQPTQTRPNSGDVYMGVPPLPGPRRFGSQTGMIPPDVQHPPVGPTPPDGNVGGTTTPQPTPPNPSKIDIRVNKSDPGNTGTGAEVEASGYDYQQNGEVFFQSGDYARAMQEFQRAIAAYQEQQRKGIHAEEAADGIRTCTLRIKLCQSKLR
jgi:tetratricopeptide (TPR) repeat protein